MLPTQTDLTFWNQAKTPKWASRIVTNVKRHSALTQAIKEYRAKNPIPVVTIDAVINSHVVREPITSRQSEKSNTVSVVRIGRKHHNNLAAYLLSIELDTGLPDRCANLHRQALVRRWRKRIIRERRLKTAHIPADYRDYLETL